MSESSSLFKFWRSALFVFQGQVIAQLIPVLSYVVIAKTISAESFGVFAIWLGVAKTYCVFATLRLENALVIEPDGEIRDKGLVLIILTALLMSMPLSLVTLILYHVVPQSLSALSPTSWLLLGPFAFFFACDVSLQTWAAADGRYRDLNRIRLAQAGLIALFQIAFVLVFRNSEGLIMGTCLGCLSALLVSYFIWPIKSSPKNKLQSELVGFWRRHKNFPKYALPAGAVSSLVAQLPVLIVGGRFGMEAGGQLALTLKMMAAPVGLLGNAVRDVFKRNAANDIATLGNCAALYKSTFAMLSLGGVAFVIIAILLAETLFVLVFGEERRQAGVFAAWLSPTFALGFVASPLSYLIFIVNRQGIDLMWQSGLLAIIFSALTFPSTLMSALWTYALGYSLMYVIYLFITYRLSLSGGKGVSVGSAHE